MFFKIASRQLKEVAVFIKPMHGNNDRIDEAKAWAVLS
jgi:hypothetical protein